ncbi:MAG: PQQ-dependent sugar dehydrogenase [Planctomycetota bacterium]
MTLPRVLQLAALAAAFALAPSGLAEDADLKRTPWTTSKIQGTPEAPPPFSVEVAFPSLRFEKPSVLVPVPSSERLLVASLHGPIHTFSRQDPSRTDLFLDLRKLHPRLNHVYGVAFSPSFANDRFVYVCYILPREPDGSRVSRFRVASLDPPNCDPKSELEILRWRAGGHNGGCLKFGPDEMLYISTGDGTGPYPPDSLRTGQDNSDLLSSILRVDVRGASEVRRYKVPADNPFVDVAGSRPEIWAFGLRNPWKMSFDEATGDLWVGDVGWELWELVFRIEKGGNYGWSIVEGPQPVHPKDNVGPTPIRPPLAEHPHAEARSITGGFVYHGKRLPELAGSYIYGDYETGKLWALASSGREKPIEIADSSVRIVGFCLDQDGELYFADHIRGTLHRLVKRPATSQPPFPARLSETGIFATTKPLVPAAGVHPYRIIAEPWHDGAHAERVIAIPGDATARPGRGPHRFPRGAVLAKTLSLEQIGGLRESRRQVETQILHYDGRDWHAYSYRWNDEQTDAELVPAEGAYRRLQSLGTVGDGAHDQLWRFSSRAECQVCHNRFAGHAIGFVPEQLDLEERFFDTQVSQLERLDALAILSPVRKNWHLVSPRDETASLDDRARSYLHANCAICHQQNRGGSTNFQLNFRAPLERLGLLDAPPLRGEFGLRNPRVVAPGDPYRSALYYRVSTPGPGRMPHLASTVVDREGQRLLHDWIQSLDEVSSHSTTHQSHAEDLAAATALTSDDPALDRLSALDSLSQTTTGALRVLRLIDDGLLRPTVRDEFLHRVATSSERALRYPFRRIFPPELRNAALTNAAINRTRVLTLSGDASLGAHVFHSTTTRCATCHRKGDVGRDLGPDLSRLHENRTRAEILDSLLSPSQVVAPEFRAYSATTRRGKIYTGILRERNTQGVHLQIADGNIVRLRNEDLVLLDPLKDSLMPEGLLSGLAEPEIADLLEFLLSHSKRKTPAKE